REVPGPRPSEPPTTGGTGGGGTGNALPEPPPGGPGNSLPDGPNSGYGDDLPPSNERVEGSNSTGGPPDPSALFPDRNPPARVDGNAIPFERDGNLEHLIRQRLGNGEVRPPVLEKLLLRLEHHPAGQEIAEIIASGRHADQYGYHTLVSDISHPDKISGVLEQLRLAERLHEQGISSTFEVKGAGHEIHPGVETLDRTDLDLMARGADGNVYGYQFKEISNPKKLFKKIFENIGQLLDSNADVQVFVIDVKGTMADLTGIDAAQRLTGLHEGKGIHFVIRAEDGTLIIPPDGTFGPGSAT
ncbi:hypothetical protein MTQ13_24290, partial [Streptomyces sp. XM4011]|nr:hypothetical protein [Streptomyces sp. XM4011]